MAASDENMSCVICKKGVKSTDIILVCGLWCRKFFHNDCVGISSSEARAVTSTNEQIKFHCEACEKRLGIELFGGKETHGPKKFENCVNNCVNLFQLVQSLIKMTNELSNNNSVINTKLDTVLTSNARLEEYFLQTPKCFENPTKETTNNSVEHVENDTTIQMEIREQNDDTNSHNRSVNSKQTERCASELTRRRQQQTDDNSSQHIASGYPNRLTDRQQQKVAEQFSSNCLQDWEMPDGHGSMQDPQNTDTEKTAPEEGGSTVSSEMIVKQEPEYPSSENFPVPITFNTLKIEVVEDEEKAVSDAFQEEYSPSEDFLGPSTFNIEKMRDDEDEGSVNEDAFNEFNHGVELTSSGGEPGSTIPVDMEDNKISDGSGRLVTNVTLSRGTCNRIQRTSLQETSCLNEFVIRHLRQRCDIYSKTFSRLQDLKEDTDVDRCEFLLSCNLCHKAFTSSSSLNKHFRVHTGKNPYECSICNKTFVQYHKLKQHLLVHTGERPYVCGVCNKPFGQKNKLKQHSQIHTGERPYICEVCQKRFRCNSHLKEHLRQHTGERPYSCNICQKKFTCKGNMRKHVLTHDKTTIYT
ncbi:zinc finger protein 3 homolog isoform X1 [Schistocerca serialis cubense]|uniref:zinc finger protein 3 homolog isoform X1 n=1 Tax=Schistocerca serialis cubense TaxID=2023355 RepID=UPI00214E8C84|nr:zinc finger protein 3 homolog isoform X1 [Schistocerca serialis cubense]